MEDCITPVSIANRIMQDEEFKGWYLIVEGQNDFKVYNRIIDNKNVNIIQGHGKEKIREILKILSERGFSNKFAIVDSDFDEILNINDDIEGLFKTDFHDIEVMVFSTNALEKVISTLCKEEKVNEVQSTKGKSIRDIVLDLAEKIGKLKLLNQSKNYELRFKPQRVDGKPLKYKKFISDKDLSFLGLDKLIQTVIEYDDNRSKKVTCDELKEEYLNLSIEQYTTYNVVNGHDLANILFICIKNVLKSNSSMLNDYKSIEDALIIGYNENDIINTKLYREIKMFQDEKDVQLLSLTYNDLSVNEETSLEPAI